MSEIIRRETEKPIASIQAHIAVARVSITALCSDDVVPKLNLQGKASVTAVGPTDPDAQHTRLLIEAEIPVLGFNEELLYVDGYMAGRLLLALREQTGELWFIFGAFRSQNGKRYYIVLPRKQVPKCLAVLDWEILSWTKKEIHQF